MFEHDIMFVLLVSYICCLWHSFSYVRCWNNTKFTGINLFQENNKLVCNVTADWLGGETWHVSVANKHPLMQTSITKLFLLERLILESCYLQWMSWIYSTVTQYTFMSQLYICLNILDKIYHPWMFLKMKIIFITMLHFSEHKITLVWLNVAVLWLIFNNLWSIHWFSLGKLFKRHFVFYYHYWDCSIILLLFSEMMLKHAQTHATLNMSQVWCKFASDMSFRVQCGKMALAPPTKK